MPEVSRHSPDAGKRHASSVAIATAVLVVVAAVGYYIETAHAIQMPDVVGFGVPWSHELHARLPAPDFSCRNCHHRSESNDSRMAACDSEGCHLRGPAMELGQPRLLRFKVTFTVPRSRREGALEASVNALRASPTVRRVSGMRWEPAASEGGDDEGAAQEPRVLWELMVDVVDRGDDRPQQMRESLGALIEQAVRESEAPRVSLVPGQRLALHRTCIGCHNAKQQGPREECADCHAENSGNASCGTCHEEVMARLSEGAHKLVSCSSCHSRGAAELVGEASHAVDVPKARMRQDCLYCHDAPEGEDPTGFPRKRLDDDQLPAIRASADEAHGPRPSE